MSRHHQVADMASVLCCCGYRVVRQTWDEFRRGDLPLCELADCGKPGRDLIRKANAERSGASGRLQRSRTVTPD